MVKIRPSVLLGRLQLIKTEKDKDFRFGRVLLVKDKWFGSRLVPIDATRCFGASECDYPEIIAMKIFVEDEGKYREVDVSKITCRSLRKGRILFEFVEGT